MNTKSGSGVTRRSVVSSALTGLTFAGIGRGVAEAAATGTSVPATTWGRFEKPEMAGFSSSKLEAMEQTLYDQPTTSMMIVRRGKLVYTYGDISHVSFLASTRKSVLSILYGKYVANGVIDLSRTLGDLGIDEKGEGLLPIEKSATIRDLLMSSSGVYWPGGSPGGDEATPPRGSKKPGSYFHYNNWDFNVAGAVFEQLTGKAVFQALADDLAGPLQLQDFDPTRQRMLGYADERSRFKAYHMFLSARDMARMGLLMINGGVWNDRQVVPSPWVKESTALRVRASDTRSTLTMGYGYLWWKPSQGRKSPEWVDSFLASGNYGQYILCLPAIDTVIVHRRAVPDEFVIARSVGNTKASPANGSITFLALAEKIIAAQT